jgi:hypothetical protein
MDGFDRTGKPGASATGAPSTSAGWPRQFPTRDSPDPDVRNKRTRRLKPSQAGLKRRNLQLFVGTGRPVRAKLRGHVAAELADSDGVFVLNGSGFPKVVLRPVVQIQQQFAHVRVARLIRLTHRTLVEALPSRSTGEGPRGEPSSDEFDPMSRSTRRSM